MNKIDPHECGRTSAQLIVEFSDDELRGTLICLIAARYLMERATASQNPPYDENCRNTADAIGNLMDIIIQDYGVQS